MSDDLPAVVVVVGRARKLYAPSPSSPNIVDSVVVSVVGVVAS